MFLYDFVWLHLSTELNCWLAHHSFGSPQYSQMSVCCAHTQNPKTELKHGSLAHCTVAEVTCFSANARFKSITWSKCS